MTPEEYRKWRPSYAQYLKTYKIHAPIPAIFTNSEDMHQRASIIGLAAEAGELLSLVQKSIRKGIPISKEKALDEGGDVFWYFNYFMEAFNLSLGEIMEYNVKKLDERNKNAS